MIRPVFLFKALHLKFVHRVQMIQEALYEEERDVIRQRSADRSAIIGTVIVTNSIHFRLFSKKNHTYCMRGHCLLSSSSCRRADRQTRHDEIRRKYGKFTSLNFEPRPSSPSQPWKITPRFFSEAAR